MSEKPDIIQKAIHETLEAAANSIQINLNNDFFIEQCTVAARILKDTSNRIITTGMGKSGLIARKVAATLTSTGSPSVYLHPADALHGDMGNIQKKEVVLAFSNSGETREIIELLPHIRYLGAKIIAVTQKTNSTLSREADECIIFDITKEGCPLQLAPMASTTVSLVIGDAVAAALIQLKQFKPVDFGKFHPSGSLGKKLLTRVSDIMFDNVKSFTMSKKSIFKEVLSCMVSSNLGAVLIEGSKGHLRGIITDGDIKRLFDSYEKDIPSLFDKTAEEIMHSDPVFIYPENLVEEAIAIMHEKSTYILPVVDKNKMPVGIVRMHDAIGYA
ncbi:MAG: KpsF/GutQ family sugar-phosphate isomerase [Spirochaetia bacterium]|nr:KpsF/GutQ family sugar-phosphate isomerase [Spirochaetia bacterium]